MSQKCPKCQSDNPATATFCADCGTQLPSIEDIEVTETMETPKEELTTGSTFAGRYQIIEELGKGGMGRVYKVLDNETNEKIALKLIKPEIAADKKIVERFRNELTTARKIAQKNVCRMYDLGKEKGSYYITMEYISGQDLKGLIRQTGQLTVGKAVSISKQICGGLTEAHDLGVVHRDLKPNNIMIDQGGNAKIMDFGIARAVKGKGITGSGVMIGTPQYMSPEQVEGKDVDQRSDLYSLGIILYEMLTARVPFEGDTPLTVGVKQKTEIPKEPKELNPQIPDDLNRVILKCLEKNQENRYQSAGELRSELERIEKGFPTTDRVIPERKAITSKEITVTFGMKRVLFPVIAIAVVVITVFLFLWKKGPTFDPNLVAVGIFENQTGNPELENLGRMACDWITQGVKETGQFEVVPVSAVVTISQEFQKGDYVQSIARETDAGKVISGTYYLQEDTLQFQSQITDTREKQLLYALDPISGPADKLDETMARLQQKVTGALAFLNDESLSVLLQLGVKPPTFDAYKELKIGYETFLGGEQERSVTHMNRAMTLDPDFKYPMAAIAAYYMNYGRWDELKELYDRAVEIRKELDPMTEIYVIDYAGARLRGDREGQYRAMRRTADLYGTTYFNYTIALNAYWINRPKEAIKMLKALDLDEPWVSDWTGYWSVLTWAYHMLGQYEQELKEARRGRQMLPERWSSLSNEVGALSALGRIDEIDRVIEESFEFPPSQSWNPGELMHIAGRGLRAHGYHEASLKILDRALVWYEGRPQDVKKTLGHRYEVARILYYLEKWEESHEIFEGLYDENPDEIPYLGYLGTNAARMGNKEEALRISEELKTIDRPYLHGENTYWRSRIAALLGEKEQAIELIRDSLLQGRTYGILYWNMDYEGIEDYPPFIEIKKPKG